MQTEMGGRYFPTLTTSRSTNRNITQVLLVLTEGHCANTQGERMKCQGWNANGWSLTLYREGRDAKWSRRLCKTCVCVVYYHTVCHTLASPHLQTPHFVIGWCYDFQWHTFLHLMPHLHLILFQCLNAFGDLHLSDNATKEGAKWSGELLCSCTRQDIVIARRLRVIVEVHQLLAPGDELNSTDCKQENSRRLIHLLVALYSTLLLLCSYKSRHKRELCKLRCKGWP